ncbi:MAG: YkgJ family cysteine cluster protein [Candidatus Helarchaeota archaeon]
MNNNLNYNITSRINESQFHCRHCGLCCKTAEILLSSREISGISYVLNINKDEFIDKYVFKKQILKIKKIQNRTYEISGTCFVLKKKNNICPFYKEHDGKSFCDIYQFRPIVCRLFPFSWEYFPESNLIIIDYSINGWEECQGIEKEKKSNWEFMRNEVIGAVILSMIQTNELELYGHLSQKLKKND